MPDSSDPDKNAKPVHTRPDIPQPVMLRHGEQATLDALVETLKPEDMPTLRAVLDGHSACDAEVESKRRVSLGSPFPGLTVQQAMVKAADTGMEVMLTLAVLGETKRHVCRITDRSFVDTFRIEPAIESGKPIELVRVGERMPHLPLVTTVQPVHSGPMSHGRPAPTAEQRPITCELPCRLRVVATSEGEEMPTCSWKPDAGGYSCTVCGLHAPPEGTFHKRIAAAERDQAQVAEPAANDGPREDRSEPAPGYGVYKFPRYPTPGWTYEGKRKGPMGREAFDTRADAVADTWEWHDLDAKKNDGRGRIAHDLRRWLPSAKFTNGGVEMSTDDGVRLLRMLAGGIVPKSGEVDHD